MGLRTDEELREQLRKFRGAYAFRTQQEPFRIFANVTLDELVEKKPRTLLALKNVKGFSDKRIEKYGQQVIDIICKSEVKSSSAFSK